MTTAAIVLAGGRGTRLGGVDKAAVKVGGRPLVDHVYAALDGFPIVAVGPASVHRPGVRVVREAPPFGGPVAAIAAALDVLGDTDETWLLACDLPRADRIVGALHAEAIDDDDGVVLIDTDGHTQWLAGRYRVAALRDAVAALPAVVGASMRQLVGGLRLRAVHDTVEASVDIDTRDELRAFDDLAADSTRTEDSHR
ncbi:molybdenum cofactor guanylyltransferase [Gordonia liuliyuniae]|uniref:Molybdenum cofactor guanylyltransferase n=1 Tax=Gordonia liuliyuniae TaxID=2911517 RepID=A0ABS9IQ38_9ACTN|nr:molybdenum cofactor guanylyltransferase [Gordonia liuliyuniae]MCF8587676.1 molybdenum cofactor guanylyltransferase [Gordonia liuliyuniae]